MTNPESLTDEELYRHIIEHIETTLSLNTDDLEVEIEDGFVSIWGSVPSIEDSEELEKLLFDMLGLEDFDFDVVVNPDLAHEPGFEDTGGFGYGANGPGIDDLGSSPRQHF